MVVALNHALKPELSPEDVARQRFVSGLRGFVLSDLAGDLRRAYDARVAPRFQGVHGRLPADGDEVHQALRTDPTFKAYSSHLHPIGNNNDELVLLHLFSMWH